jgi:threonyl-tRNA synthetase
MSTHIENTRHSFAHLLAAAVKRLYDVYPERNRRVKFGIGPIIENGFYYDFDNIEISDKDLPKIEKEMRKIAIQGHDFKKEEWPADKAREYFEKEEQIYKLELIKELSSQLSIVNGQLSPVGMVYMGEAFLDLCKGGHVINTKDLPSDAF